MRLGWDGVLWDLAGLHKLDIEGAYIKIIVFWPKFEDSLKTPELS